MGTLSFLFVNKILLKWRLMGKKYRGISRMTGGDQGPAPSGLHTIDWTEDGVR